MKKRLYALFVSVANFLPLAAFADGATCNPGPDYKTPGGLMAGVSDGCGKCGSCQIADFFIVGNNITKIILGLSGSVLLAMFIYSGFIMLTSRGNSSLVEKGKSVLISSIIGLVIVFGAYTAIQFIMGALGVPNVSEVFKRPFQTSGK